MATPKGNQLWELLDKHNQKVLFELPELLLQSAYEYFNS